jgi:hypothetical protein
MTLDEIRTALHADGWTTYEQPIQESRWPDGYCIVGYYAEARRGDALRRVVGNFRITAWELLYQQVFPQ